MFSIGRYLSQLKSDSDLTKDQVNNTATHKTVIVAPEPQQKPLNDYTQLIRTNETADRVIQSCIQDTRPLRQLNPHIRLPKPSADEIAECTAKTKAVIDGILQQRNRPPTTKKDKKGEYIRYTSSDVLSGQQTSSRIIKIIDQQIDPMAPTKFKQKKQMERPPSPPVPLLHDPTSSNVTKEDQAKWYIPPAISNWKNPNGFTIALDKRVAVEGDVEAGNNGAINENFMNLAQALEDADKKAREEIKLRNAMKKKIAEKENREKEEKLRLLAQKAREERSKYNERLNSDGANPDAQRRAEIRAERRKNAERELRMSRMGNETRLKAQAKSLLGRDISERTQLGLAKATQSSETQFDSRLFTNATQIQNSEDQMYDSPLFAQQAVSNIYRASQQGFDGDDHLKEISTERRFDSLGNVDATGPVEFEKDSKRSNLDHDSEYGLQKQQRTK